MSARLTESTIIRAIRAARKEGGCVVKVQEDGVVEITPLEAKAQTTNPADLVELK